MPKGRGKSWSGDFNVLVEALAPHVVSVQWLDYPEDSPRTRVKQLIRARSWLQKLQCIYKPLSFKNSDFDKVLRQIIEMNGSTWPKPLKESHIDQWVKVHAKRMTLACKHFGKALRRQKAPRWLEKMSEAACECTGDDGQLEEEEEEEEEEEDAVAEAEMDGDTAQASECEDAKGT